MVAELGVAAWGTHKGIKSLPSSGTEVLQGGSAWAVDGAAGCGAGMFTVL